MSRGALKELIHASLRRFRVLVKDVPPSEKREIAKIFQKHVNILRGNF